VRVAPEAGLNAGPVLPFHGSRRLTGANLFFARPGAQLRNRGDHPDEDLLRTGGRARRAHARTSAAYAGGRLAPPRARRIAGARRSRDQLLLRTEVNEWALCAALLARDPRRWGGVQDALVAAALEDAADAHALIAPVLEEPPPSSASSVWPRARRARIS